VSLMACLALCAGLGINMTNMAKLLADAEASRGLPTGLLSSVMQQETGGKADYVMDPAKYHYPVNKKGLRVAGHTGKVSTAFGPFGLLESTGAKPGYGVEPLKDKSLPEQVRFAADYLGARIKHAGDIATGLSRYGEGTKYAEKVLSRLGWKPEAKQVAAAPVQEQVPTQAVVPAAAVSGAAPVEQVAQAPSLSEGIDARLGELRALMTKNQPFTDVATIPKPTVKSESNGFRHPYLADFMKYSGFYK
jgi:hypothetical protein